MSCLRASSSPLLKRRAGAAAGLLALCLPLGGCGALISSVADSFAENLTTAVLNQRDPQIVEDGLPAYLLLLDSLIEASPGSESTLAAGAELYSAYAAVFVEDAERARHLTERARDYGDRAICLRHRPACRWEELEYDAFVTALDALPEKRADLLYAQTVSHLAWIRAHSDDYVALAQLPHVEARLERLRDMENGYQRANVHLYLGVLNTLRGAVGGGLDEGRDHFVTAVELTDGRDLAVKVEYARSYARMVYDRELHDRLLQEVLTADPVAPSLTLLNTLAQEQARALLGSADDYF